MELRIIFIFIFILELKFNPNKMTNEYTQSCNSYLSVKVAKSQSWHQGTFFVKKIGLNFSVRLVLFGFVVSFF